MLPPPAIRGVFRTDERARAAYAEGAGIYRILPAAVCLPADREDLVSLVGWASAHRFPLVPRGAGSAMGGGNVGEGVIVDLTGLARRLEIRPAERIAVTSANITLAELNIAGRCAPAPAAARSLQRTLRDARRHGVHQRLGRADRPLRERAALGPGARAGDRGGRGARAAPRRRLGRPIRGDGPADRGRRGSGGRRRPRADRGPVSQDAQELLRLCPRGLDRLGRPARPRHRRRRHPGIRHPDRVAAGPAAGSPGRAPHRAALAG